MQHIISQLSTIVGIKNLLLQIEKKYCQDWRGNFSTKPLAIVFPSDTQQIIEIVKLCIQHNISLVIQGGNTSLCGGAVTDNSGSQILLNLKNLNKIISIDTINNSIIVEAGCTLEQVQQSALAHNLLYPLSLPSEKHCTIGGNLSTNAGGVAVLKYGNSRNLCLGLEAVMPDGNMYNGLASLYKNNMGYDIKQFLIGAEGTLGIITKASLRLYPLPKKYIAFWLNFNDFSQIINTFKDLQNYYAHAISSFEIMNEQSINCIRLTSPDLLDIINNQNLINKNKITAWNILLELEQHGYEINIQYLKQKYANHILATEIYKPKQISKLWQIRHAIPNAQKALGGNIKHDISLNLENMQEFIQTMPQKIKLINEKTELVIFGHIGDGNLHYNIISDEKYKADIQAIIYEQVLKYKGSIAAEHGIGKLKVKLLKKSINNTQYLIAKNIKNLLDKNNLFNPQVIFE